MGTLRARRKVFRPGATPRQPSGPGAEALRAETARRAAFIGRTAFMGLCLHSYFRSVYLGPWVRTKCHASGCSGDLQRVRGRIRRRHRDGAGDHNEPVGTGAGTRACPRGGAARPDKGTYAAEVLRVLDGDTFEARVHLWPALDITTKVRLRGIDAPEMKARCREERNLAEAARDAL